MKFKFIFCIIAAATFVACGGHEHHNHAEHAHDGHTHDEHLQLTVYNDAFELFAEATPFVAGESSDILAHFSHLNNFKPLESGTVTAKLIVGSNEASQTLNAPVRAGVYRFSLVPPAKGSGKIIFDISTADGVSQMSQNIVVYEDEHNAHHAAAHAAVQNSNGVVFTKEMSWKVDFATEQCRKEPFARVIRTVALVESAQGDERVLTAKSSGVVSFPVAGLVAGQAVNAGESLLFIEGGDITDNNITVRYREAENNYNLAKSEYERKAGLAKDKIVSEGELLQAKRDYDNAAAVYNNIRKNHSAGGQAVAAPISGYIKELSVRNGEFVEAGQPVAVVSQNRNLFIKAELQPRYYTALENFVGANIKLLNDDRVYSLEELGGQLLSYGKALSVGAPLLPVVFRVNNTVNLLPGSFVEIFIKAQSEQEAVVVPCEALVEEMGSYFVYVQLTPEYFEKREVSVGATDGKNTEILSGLNAEERIVTKGAVLVKLAQATGTLDAHAGHVH